VSFPGPIFHRGVFPLPRHALLARRRFLYVWTRPYVSVACCLSLSPPTSRSFCSRRIGCGFSCPTLALWSPPTIQTLLADRFAAVYNPCRSAHAYPPDLPSACPLAEVPSFRSCNPSPRALIARPSRSKLLLVLDDHQNTEPCSRG